MKECKELKSLRGKILGIEMELNLLSKDLERFDMELKYNLKLLKNVETNLTFLKNKAPIVSLISFKQSCQQKKYIENKIVYYKNKINELKNILNIKEFSHKKDMEEFERLYKLRFENNILEIKNYERRKKA